MGRRNASAASKQQDHAVFLAIAALSAVYAGVGWARMDRGRPSQLTLIGSPPRHRIAAAWRTLIQPGLFNQAYSLEPINGTAPSACNAHAGCGACSGVHDDDGGANGGAGARRRPLRCARHARPRMGRAAVVAVAVVAEMQTRNQRRRQGRVPAAWCARRKVWSSWQAPEGGRQDAIARDDRQDTVHSALFK